MSLVSWSKVVWVSWKHDVNVKVVDQVNQSLELYSSKWTLLHAYMSWNLMFVFVSLYCLET
jgi:hypothetical protein